MKMNPKKLNLSELKKIISALLKDIPIETDILTVKNEDGKYLYVHFKDRNETFSASKAAKQILSHLPTGIKYAAPSGFDSYKTLIWIPENQELTKMRIDGEETIECRVCK